MASRAGSISVKDLSAQIDKALEDAQRRGGGNRPHIKREPEFLFNYPWIIGFILREADVAGTNLHELQAIAHEVATELQVSSHVQGEKAVGGAGMAEHALLFHGGHVTMGFFPTKEFSTAHE
jgi:hypothetical protein